MRTPTMFNRLKDLFSPTARDARLRAKLDELRRRTPVPVLWLYGKTQSGKTSVIKYLTGAEEAEIGHGFRPCTRYSREYQFPTPDAPLVTFLDTRGVDEPGYDPAVDLEQFDSKAHLVIVTVKATDHALEHVIDHLKPIRNARPDRPIILVPTCLHEAYPQQQHPEPYPYGPPPAPAEANGSLPTDGEALPGPPVLPGATVPDELDRSVRELSRRFQGLADRVVPVDLTKSEEGFHEPNYGGPLLKDTLLELLPAAYRQTLMTLEEASRELQDFYARQALPHIIGYSTLAATAGAIPVPWLDLLILPSIQTQMIAHLATLYGQPRTGRHFTELAGTLGLGVVARQAVREVVKFIPYVGSVVGAAMGGASTYALGKAFCYYYSAVHRGHVPKPEDLKHYYQEELSRAEKSWGKKETQQAPGEPSVGMEHP